MSINKKQRDDLMIVVNQYIKTAFSVEDANMLLPIIEKELAESGKVDLDFSGIEIFTTLFFNNLIANYVVRLSPAEFNKRLKCHNLSDVGVVTYRRSYENAIEHYDLQNQL